jgi:hypothetical protein
LIAIDKLATGRIYLLWGIDIGYADDSLTDAIDEVPLYRASATGNIGPYNSFNIGFSFSETSPISGRYSVTIDLYAQGILEGSIAHNLPQYQGLEVYCHYDTTNKKIICDNVGPFISTNYRYFISGKAFFSSATAPSLSTFGDVKITPVIYDSAGNMKNVKLYSPLVSGETVYVKESKEFLDTNGYHNVDTFKIGNAQVVSFVDDGSLSSTGKAMKSFLTGTNSTVGVIPDLGESQQLLFLMKTTSSDISVLGEASK